MTLASLLAIQRLQAFNATAQGVQRLLAGVTRNLLDYGGDPVRDAVVTECITQAEALLAHTRQFLHIQFPDLLVKP
jgi:hypothetical protein